MENDSPTKISRGNLGRQDVKIQNFKIFLILNCNFDF